MLLCLAKNDIYLWCTTCILVWNGYTRLIIIFIISHCFHFSMMRTFRFCPLGNFQALKHCYPFWSPRYMADLLDLPLCLSEISYQPLSNPVASSSQETQFSFLSLRTDFFPCFTHECNHIVCVFYVPVSFLCVGVMHVHACVGACAGEWRPEVNVVRYLSQQFSTLFLRQKVSLIWNIIDLPRLAGQWALGILLPHPQPGITGAHPMPSFYSGT